jgi:hypothetical protein
VYIHLSPKATVANTQKLAMLNPTPPVMMDRSREGNVFGWFVIGDPI